MCDPKVTEETPALTHIANPLHYPLDQILTMFLLADRGIACIGRSGAGKTALMGPLEGRTDLERLSDDPLILRAGESIA